jgi:DNA-binding NarL/FixJ family response regulator
MVAKFANAVKNKHKIFLVEDHMVFRQGLIWIIEQDKEFEVCGEAVDGFDALNQIKNVKPDLVLVDIGLAGMSGIELTKNIRSSMPDVRILILSMHKESLYAERALRAGANGYIMKRESGEELISAIRQVLDGRTYVSKELNETLLQKVAGSGRKVTEFSIDLISDRELEVFQRIGHGLSTRQIAEELNISMKTIEAHREHIRAKLNLKTNADLVQYAIHWVHSEKNLD